MTGPRLSRRNYGRGHGYKLDGVKVPGVTTIQGLLDKPGLIDWAAREAAGYAIENWAELSGVPLLERADRIRKARFEKNAAAKISGTKVHHYGHQIALGHDVQVPDEYVPAATAYARLLDRLDLTVELAEAPCASTTYGYAGTLDLIGSSPRLGRALIDLKTGNGIYQDTALQVNAYGACDIVQRVEPGDPGPRGGKPKHPKITELPMGYFDSAWIIHVRGDHAEIYPCRLSDRDEVAFLSLLELWRTWLEPSRNQDHDDYDPPVGEPVDLDEWDQPTEGE